MTDLSIPTVPKCIAGIPNRARELAVVPGIQFWLAARHKTQIKFQSETPPIVPQFNGESAHFRTVSRFFSEKVGSVSKGRLAFQDLNLFHAGTVHGAANHRLTSHLPAIKPLPEPV
jgi:hypothetical protein